MLIEYLTFNVKSVIYNTESAYCEALKCVNSSLKRRIKMTGLTTFDINRFTPYAVGFDRVFDQLMNHTHNMTSSTGFPPYNIVKHTDFEFSIEMALAGLTKEDIEVEVSDGTITVKSVWDSKAENAEVLHRGISHKKFTRKFTIADDIEVKGASFENGLLEINLERIVPDHKKPRIIKIK